jgi:hypothetical protein
MVTLGWPNKEVENMDVKGMNAEQKAALIKDLKGSYKAIKAKYGVQEAEIYSLIQDFTASGELVITPSNGNANTRFNYIKAVKATMTPESKTKWIDGVEKNFKHSLTRIDVIELNKI